MGRPIRVRTNSQKTKDGIAAVGTGEIVIAADDEDRENEVHLTLGAEKITPEPINFMVSKIRC